MKCKKRAIFIIIIVSVLSVLTIGTGVFALVSVYNLPGIDYSQTNYTYYDGKEYYINQSYKMISDNYLYYQVSRKTNKYVPLYEELDDNSTFSNCYIGYSYSDPNYIMIDFHFKTVDKYNLFLRNESQRFEYDKDSNIGFYDYYVWFVKDSYLTYHWSEYMYHYDYFSSLIINKNKLSIKYLCYFKNSVISDIEDSILSIHYDW